MKRFIIFSIVFILGIDHSHGKDRLDETCGAVNKKLIVKLTYAGNANSFKDCKDKCLAKSDCTHYILYKANFLLLRMCWIAKRSTFGVRKIYIQTGPPVCPSNDYCMNPDVKYSGGSKVVFPFPNTTRECQQHCKKDRSNVAFTYDHERDTCYCIKNRNFLISHNKNYTSGDVACAKCFQFGNDLSLLRDVTNGGPNDYITVSSAEECQESCKNNTLCDFFEFFFSIIGNQYQCRHKNVDNLERDSNMYDYAPRDCDISCTCNLRGVIGDDVSCNNVGQCNNCNRQAGYTGKTCYTCKHGYRKVGATCNRCTCKGGHCTDNDPCICKHSYDGDECDILAVREIMIGYLLKGESVKVIFYCYGQCDFDDLDVKFKNGHVIVEGFDRNFHVRGPGVVATFGNHFCSSSEQNDHHQKCSKEHHPKNDTMFLWLYAVSNSTQVKFTYQVPVAKNVTWSKA